MFSDNALMSPDFDEGEYLRYALHTSNFEVEQSRLTACSATVQESMYEILNENAENILKQVAAACRARREVAAIRQAASSLVQSTNRLRHTIQEPYHQINANIMRLRNTSAALCMLRNILKFVTLTTRLAGQLDTDVARAARTLQEIRELLTVADINDVDLVKSRLISVENAKATIQSRAQEILKQGKALDGLDVGVALQCLFALGTLPGAIIALMNEQRHEVETLLAEELSIRKMVEEISTANSNSASGGRGSAGVNDIGSHTSKVLFGHVQSALSSTARCTRVVVAVWRVLVKKTDHVSQTPYLSDVADPTYLLSNYWAFITDKLVESLQEIQKQEVFFAAMASGVLLYRSLLFTFLDGVKELLEIIGRLTEADALAIRRASRSSHPSGGRNAAEVVEELRSSWLMRVTQVVNERFSLQIVDRHMGRMHGIIERLQSIFPILSSRLASGKSADSQQSHTAMISQTLEVQSYTKLALQDIMEYRSDCYTLSVVLGSIVHCIKTLMQHITESINKRPLPPLPSVAAEVTAIQLLHICVSNACSLLCVDLALLLAYLPEEDFMYGDATSSLCSQLAESDMKKEENVRNRAVHCPNMLVLESRTQLREITAKLSEICEKVVYPFFRSASVLLLDSVSMCVYGSQGQEATGVAQLESQMRHFMRYFYSLFEPKTPALDDCMRMLMDNLMTRLLVAVSLLTPFNRATQQHIVTCLQKVPSVIILFAPSTHGAASRSTMLLKGQLRQLMVWYSLTGEIVERSPKEAYAVLATLPLVVSRLLLLQRIPQSSVLATKPCSVLGDTFELSVESVEAGVLEQLHISSALKTRSMDVCNSVSCSPSRVGELLATVEKRFDEACRTLCNDAAQDPVVQWVKDVWLLLNNPPAS
uniref:Conserved oligomeric Golgi complex subunit 5 n=1 Tax=Trypanosoma vivax (strain Y486) TaxID=1055687 RepID=G0U9L5_TRYVY|nr:conserved hypothetical protein [Trypanosoma vivax Y486]